MKDNNKKLNKYFSKEITKQIVTAEKTETELSVGRKFKLNSDRRKINNENEKESIYGAKLAVPTEISSSKINLLGRIIYLLKPPEKNIIINSLAKLNNLILGKEAAYLAPSVNLISSASVSAEASAEISIIKTNKNSEILRQKKTRDRRAWEGVTCPVYGGNLIIIARYQEQR